MDTGSNTTAFNSPHWFDTLGRSNNLTAYRGDRRPSLQSGVARLSVRADDGELYVLVMRDALYVPASRNLVGLEPLTKCAGLVSATVSNAPGGMSWLDLGDLTLRNDTDGWPVLDASPAPLLDDRPAPPRTAATPSSHTGPCTNCTRPSATSATVAC